MLLRPGLIVLRLVCGLLTFTIFLSLSACAASTATPVPLTPTPTLTALPPTLTPTTLPIPVPPTATPTAGLSLKTTTPSLNGHSFSISALAFSTDGKILAASDWNGLVMLHEVATGKVTGTIYTTTVVYSLAFSPDSKLLATVGADATVKLWDTATGKLSSTWYGHKNYLRSVAFSPDGKIIATGGDDKLIKLWDTASGQNLATLSEHTASVYALAFSPDSKMLASGGKDKNLKLWDVSSYKLVYSAQGHNKAVNSVVFSPDNTTILTASGDNTVKVWDRATYKLKLTLWEHTDAVNTLAFSPDGKFFASGSDDNSIKLWDASTNKLLVTMPNNNKSSVMAVAFSPDGKTLASGEGSPDNAIKLWQVPSGQLLTTWSGHNEAIRTISLSPDGKQAVSASSISLKFWETATGKLLNTVVPAEPPLGTSFSPDGTIVAAPLSESFQISLWNSTTGKLMGILKGHTSYVIGVVFSLDSSQLISASYDGTIRVWEIATGNLQKLIKVGSPITAITLNPDGITAAVISDKPSLELWDITSGNQKVTVNKDYFKYVFNLTYTARGSVLAGSGYYGNMYLWFGSTGDLATSLVSQSKGNIIIAATPGCCPTLVSAGNDGVLEVWKLKDLAGITSPLYSLQDDGVSALALSPDGKLLVTGHLDAALKIWQIN